MLAYHSANDAPLLIVFLSEHRHIRLHDIEQLRHDSSNSSEENGPVVPTKRLLQPLHTNPCLVTTLLLGVSNVEIVRVEDGVHS